MPLKEYVGRLLTIINPTVTSHPITISGALKISKSISKLRIIGKHARPAAAGAGTPEKNLAAKGLGSRSSNFVLNLASRRAIHVEKNRTLIQPNPPSTSVLQKNKIRAGATPKLIKSDKESNSAPNRLCPFRRRAIRPSKVSSIAASPIAATANSHRSCTANRIPVRPEHRASTVIKFGMTVLIDIIRSRPLRDLSAILSLRISLVSVFHQFYLPRLN